MARSGRPRKWPSKRSRSRKSTQPQSSDFGTYELQAKRISAIGGNPDKLKWNAAKQRLLPRTARDETHLSESLLGVLLARKIITSKQFREGQSLQKLNWMLFSKPFAATQMLDPNLRGGHSDLSESPQQQSRIQRARKHYATCLGEIGKLGRPTLQIFRSIVFEDRLPFTGSLDGARWELTALNNALDAVAKITRNGPNYRTTTQSKAGAV